MPKTQKQRNNAYRARKREIATKAGKSGKNVIAKSQKDLEGHCAAWLKHFLPSAYPLPFGQVHHDIIEKSLYAANNGVNFAVAAPRGTGKSSVLWGVALYLLMTGKIRFPAYLPWAGKDTKKALRFWKNALCYNETLAAAYPDICLPFVQSGGTPQKLLNLTINGRTTGAQLRISDGMIVLPHSLGVIGSSTVNGNPRGLNHAAENGEVLRPDLILIDDPQDKETARSGSLVRNVIDVIDSDIMGMAGPDKTMPCLMACTVLCDGDVADYYLSDKTPDWGKLRVPQITNWPENRKDWDAWNEARLAGEELKDGGSAGIAYYNANKEKLTAGMTVSWEHRFDKNRGHPDALYSAMLDYYRMGHHAFMAERQNQPVTSIGSVYELSADTVLSKISDRAAYQLSENITILTAYCDINRIGLHWCVAGFDQQMTCHVAAYGRHPGRGWLWAENAPDLVKQKAIYVGLLTVCQQIGGYKFMRGDHKMSVNLMLIDAAFESSTVHRFVNENASKLPFRVVASIGRAAHKYRWNRNTIIGQPLEGIHLQRTENRRDAYVMINADHWREIAQRSWLGAIGEPGGSTLYKLDNNKLHQLFAEQVTAEKLVNKYMTDIGPRWEWTHRPGSVWDWGDAFSGCWAGAALCGLQSGGIPTTTRKQAYKETRKARVAMT